MLAEASSFSNCFSKASIASRSKLFFGGGFAKSWDVLVREVDEPKFRVSFAVGVKQIAPFAANA